MTLLLSEALIRTRTAEAVFSRGQTYYQQGAVGTLVQRGDNSIETEIKIGHSVSYYISLHILDRKVVGTKCSSCKTDRWCEHVAATLLKCLYEPEQIESRPALDTLLEPLSRPQLQGLMISLVRQHPGLTNEVEHLLSSYPTDGNLSQTYKQEIQKMRRQIRISLSYGFENDLTRQFLQKAANWIGLGDLQKALIVLEILTQEAVRQWQKYRRQYEYQDDGFIAEFLAELDTTWATLFLAFPPTEVQREYRKSCLNLWEHELAPLKTPFLIALKVLEYKGWNYTHLQRVLQGDTELPLWEDESPQNREQLVRVHLHWLLQQRRYQEYLYLAKRRGHHLTYLKMLFKLDKWSAIRASWEIFKKTVLTFGR